MALFDRKFLGFKSDERRKAGRLGELAKNRLGLISQVRSAFPKESIRNPKLELLDAYYERRQYAGLPEWDQNDPDAEYIPVRKRTPRLQLNFAKTLISRITSKMVGENTFPQFKIEDDMETEEYFRFIIKASKLKGKIVEPTKRMFAVGSVFVRFQIINGSFQFEHFLSKFCHPKFTQTGDLEFVRIQFIFDDLNTLDENGEPKKMWFRMDLSQFTDIKWKPVEFKEGVEPVFEAIEEQVEHQMGFVQGEWFRTMEQPDTPDGPSLIEDILDFIDELNYNFSQSSHAIQYNQDPQLSINGLDQEELDNLIRSSQKAWNLGREGKAEFLESTMNGVTAALEFRDKVRLNIQDISRIVLLDPEKAVAHAQSARAMEVLHGPMIELIHEVRPFFEINIVSLVVKMAVANLIVVRRGDPAPVTIPPGFQPKSMMITLSWPPIFPLTMEDLQKKMGVANTAAAGLFISRETAMRFVAKDFGIEDIEEEQRKIDAQPVINPFGGF